jgi:hypothetical protein
MSDTFTPEMLDDLDAVAFVKVEGKKVYVDWGVVFPFLTLAILTKDPINVATGLVTINDAIRGLEARATQT